MELITFNSDTIRVYKPLPVVEITQPDIPSLIKPTEVFPEPVVQTVVIQPTNVEQPPIVTTIFTNPVVDVISEPQVTSTPIFTSSPPAPDVLPIGGLPTEEQTVQLVQFEEPPVLVTQPTKHTVTFNSRKISVYNLVVNPQAVYPTGKPIVPIIPEPTPVTTTTQIETQGSPTQETPQSGGASTPTSPTSGVGTTSGTTSSGGYAAPQTGLVVTFNSRLIRIYNPKAGQSVGDGIGTPVYPNPGSLPIASPTPVTNTFYSVTTETFGKGDVNPKEALVQGGKSQIITFDAGDSFEIDYVEVNGLKIVHDGNAKSGWVELKAVTENLKVKIVFIEQFVLEPLPPTDTKISGKMTTDIIFNFNTGRWDEQKGNIAAPANLDKKPIVALPFVSTEKSKFVLNFDKVIPLKLKSVEQEKYLTVEDYLPTSTDILGDVFGDVGKNKLSLKEKNKKIRNKNTLNLSPFIKLYADMPAVAVVAAFGGIGRITTKGGTEFAAELLKDSLIKTSKGNETVYEVALKISTALNALSTFTYSVGQPSVGAMGPSISTPI